MAQDLTENLKQLQRLYFDKPIKEDAVQLLSGGNSPNKNYRIDDSGITYLVRFMPSNRPLASREKECLITEYAGKIGVGAKVYYQNPQQGILITEFIQGRTANYYDMVNEPNRNLLIAHIKKLHQSDPMGLPKARSLAVQIQETLKRVDSIILQQQLEALELIAPLNSLFHCIENNLATTMTHGDLNPNNILIANNRVYFIDWTDAGIGDPFTDIAWHAMFFPLSLHENLLRYYFEHINILMRAKLLCYYCLRLFLSVAEDVGYAKKISASAEHSLIDLVKQKNLAEPYDVIVGIFTNKLTFNSNDLLLVSAIHLNFLSRFTKTDAFLSAIEELSHNG